MNRKTTPINNIIPDRTTYFTYTIECLETVLQSVIDHYFSKVEVLRR